MKPASPFALLLERALDLRFVRIGPVLLVALALTSHNRGDFFAAERPQRPNIVFVLADDK